MFAIAKQFKLCYIIKNISGETCNPLQFTGHKVLRKSFAASSLGRVASYTDDINKDGKFLNGSLTPG